MYKQINADQSKNIITYLTEIFRKYPLILQFVKRDLKIKYAQTALGLSWSFIQPLIGLVIFTYFFGRLLNIGTDGSPYPVFVYPGITAWYCFSYIVAYSSISLIESQNLIKKVYFPKLILPVSKSITALAEYSIWLIILIALLFIYDIPFTWRFFLFPVFIVLNILTGLSIGIWLSALTYRYRDLIHIIPYLVGFSIFITPVFYPTKIIPISMNYAFFLNPIAGVIHGYRWCLNSQIDFKMQYLSGFLIMLVFLFLSVHFFIRVEKKMADII